MKYEVATAEKSTVKITMTFSHDEWAQANDKAYLANRKRYSVNGFRKGKAPKHVLELRERALLRGRAQRAVLRALRHRS